MVENTDKTFSFKDSLRESTKNNNTDTHATHRYRGDPRSVGGGGRANSNDQARNVDGNIKTTKCYQNNYYYNFNNNYAAGPGPASFEQFRDNIGQHVQPSIGNYNN